MESFDKKYIPNTLDNNKFNLEDLQLQTLKIFEQDFKTFISSIRPEDTTAFASLKHNNKQDFSSFDGAGSYLSLYIHLLKFLKGLKSPDLLSETKIIGEYLPKIEGFSETLLMERAEKSYRALVQLVKIKEKTSERVQIGYYFGGAGVFLNGLILAYYKRDPKMFQENLKEILSYKEIVVNDFDSHYKELLYGVTGYLYCLLKVQDLCQSEKLGSEFHVNIQADVRIIMGLLLDEGINNYNPNLNLSRLPKDFRLVYTFCGSEYFGAAHGLFGVLYMLIKAYQMNTSYLNKEDQALVIKYHATVKASLQYLLQNQLKSGAFPVAEGFYDGAVQFCHGSPGAVHCLILASEAFKGYPIADECWKGALLAGEDIWKYGILKKGFGLCHGITGNAYSFLALYMNTLNPKWLYRAYRFAGIQQEKEYMEIIKGFEFEGRDVKGMSDFPFSLMMGLAGDICFEVDALLPEIARFPGYEI